MTRTLLVTLLLDEPPSMQSGGTLVDTREAIADGLRQHGLVCRSIDVRFAPEPVDVPAERTAA